MCLGNPGVFSHLASIQHLHPAYLAQRISLLYRCVIGTWALEWAVHFPGVLFISSSPLGSSTLLAEELENHAEG